MENLSFRLFAAGLLFFCTNTHAQDFALGVRGGLSNLTAGSGNKNLPNTGYSSRLNACKPFLLPPGKSTPAWAVMKQLRKFKVGK